MPLILKDSASVKKASERLKEAGYWALPIRPPTVPKGEARLRFSITYDHPRALLDALTAEIKKI